VLQRGDDLTLSLELVDAKTGDQMWGEQYNRKLTDLVALQGEVARDVADSLQARLSGADEQKLTKRNTTNPEAYRLYLKGRYHTLKTTRPEIQTGISYFQQAVTADPSYALAYVGLADAYRALPLGGEMPPAENFQKAKAAAQKAIEIDNNLADAHAILGFIIFWYEWDWGGAEGKYKRAMELDPKNADARLFYAHMLSNLGRHEEALAEVKGAVELDPVNLRTNALAGQFLLHAGRADEAIGSLRKTIELDPNFQLAHQFATSAYYEKGMYAEAEAKAKRATEVSNWNTQPIAFNVYVLVKTGGQAEARAALAGLVKLSSERYIQPYHIAQAYNGLGEADEAIAWLRRGVEQRDPKVIFLKVEPKWNNLRPDPRFADLMRRVGLPQ
jgi:tetratricopeptide (TPR) repeat protein